ncbi:MAG: hypothetical protein D6687_07415 [Acidobacteria bacterium]|jgi:uncharacterized protein YxeA|nr:MAG: hypothetical protein D6687_07415 [Acidobacteriota bacterium]GIU81666.1 MAG: hypothetical protein KatS3mg006_0730 [Pyrinomonadaceae bacterium]
MKRLSPLQTTFLSSGFSIVISFSVILSLAVLFLSACSSDSALKTEENQARVSDTRQSESQQREKSDEIPESVKKLFPDAQSFVKQRKELSQSAIESIEKDTGTKLASKEHYAYLAFTTKDGKRTQIGAATILNVEGKEIIIVYESKDGMPTVKEIHAKDVPKAFLDQFIGKNHDSKIKFGEDIKAKGADERQAKAITQAVRVDVLTMEALYGKPHTH